MRLKIEAVARAWDRPARAMKAPSEGSDNPEETRLAEATERS
jgi:hypothetical protein